MSLVLDYPLGIWAFAVENGTGWSVLKGGVGAF